MKRKKRNFIGALSLFLTASLLFPACGKPDSASSVSSESYDVAETKTGIYEDIPTSEELLPLIDDDEVIQIGYMAQNETIQFCVTMSDYLKKEAEKYGDKIELHMVDARSIAANQISEAEDFVAKNMDVVIFNAIDQEASAPALTIMKDAGIPVVLVNTVTNNAEIADVYVGVDDSEAGRMLIQLASQALGEEGGIINIIEGILGDPAGEKRSEGIYEELELHPEITVGSSHAADWDRAKAMNITEDWIISNQDFDMIVALNDEMAISSLYALEASNVDVPVIGVDAIDEAIQLVNEGRMYGTVLQDAVRQGAGSLNAAVALAVGYELVDEYIIPYQIINSENVEEFLNYYDE